MNHRKQNSRATSPGACGEERGSAQDGFVRFLDGELNGRGAMEAFLAQLRALLAQRDPWRRGERTGEWFNRLVRDALHRCANTSQPTALTSADQQGPAAMLPRKWAVASRGFLFAVLGELNPRYAELIRRVDFGFEPRIYAAHRANLSRAQLDVTLHRARGALRGRILHVCERMGDGGVSNLL